MNKLNSISSKPKSAIALALERDGYAFLEEWHPDLTSTDLVHRSGLVLNFGKAPVHRVIPQQDGPPNTYSGIYGLGEFPLHSDMAHWPEPPRYMFLRCLKGQSAVGTAIVDSCDIIEDVGTLDLARALVKPRRPLHGRIPLLSIFRPQRGNRSMLFRWDDRYIVPASPAGQLGVAMIRAALPRSSMRLIYLCKAGDTLWLDNWRMLHGRSSVPEDRADRVLERAYFGEVF